MSETNPTLNSKLWDQIFSAYIDRCEIDTGTPTPLAAMSTIDASRVASAPSHRTTTFT